MIRNYSGEWKSECGNYRVWRQSATEFGWAAQYKDEVPYLCEYAETRGIAQKYCRIHVMRINEKGKSYLRTKMGFRKVKKPKMKFTKDKQKPGGPKPVNVHRAAWINRTDLLPEYWSSECGNYRIWRHTSLGQWAAQYKEEEPRIGKFLSSRAEAQKVCCDHRDMMEQPEVALDPSR